MKKILLLMLAMVMLLSCGGEKKADGGAAGGDKPAEGKKVKIGVTIYKYDDNFMATLRKDLEAFAKQSGNSERTGGCTSFKRCKRTGNQSGGSCSRTNYY